MSETLFLLRHFVNGGSSGITAVRRLIEDNEPEQAACVARLALRTASEEERSEIFTILAELTDAPDGWATALEEFANNASEERWQQLMSFVPEEVFYDRLKYTVLLLIAHRCDGDVLFRCVSNMGYIPELHDLAQSGLVHPDTIVHRATGSPVEGVWLGLAALAANARGDDEAAIRHLWRACQLDPILSRVAVDEVRHAASAAFNAQLDAAGIPPGFGSSEDEAGD